MLTSSLAQLQTPLQDALAIASMENNEFTTIRVDHSRQLLQLIDMLAKVTDKAAKSVDYCQAAVQLPPYPALGLAWMAMANNTSSIDITASKAVHSLVNSITVVNLNKRRDGELVPVPALPGIRPPQQVAIRPRKNQAKVMLSKVSIKDHPHREEIVELTKNIHSGEPKHLRKGKNARDYLMQAKMMFESSQSSTSVTSNPQRPQPKSHPMGTSMPKVTFAQTVKKDKQRGEAVFPPKMPPTQIPVAPKPSSDWQKVKRKQATRPGTKTTMVSSIIPVTHQILRAMLMSVNKEALRHHFLGILELVPGMEELLGNNPLERVNWSLNRDILHVTFSSPIDDNLRTMTHHAIRKFFNVSDDTVPTFIE